MQLQSNKEQCRDLFNGSGGHLSRTEAFALHTEAAGFEHRTFCSVEHSEMLTRKFHRSKRRLRHALNFVDGQRVQGRCFQKGAFL